jgi:hypothetical protein
LAVIRSRSTNHPVRPGPSAGGAAGDVHLGLARRARRGPARMARQAPASGRGGAVLKVGRKRSRPRAPGRSTRPRATPGARVRRPRGGRGGAAWPLDARTDVSGFHRKVAIGPGASQSPQNDTTRSLDRARRLDPSGVASDSLRKWQAERVPSRIRPADRPQSWRTSGSSRRNGLRP